MKIENLPIFGICGWSGSGKTTLVEQIIPKFTARGLKVAVLKHDAHRIQVDRPGKDSDRFFQAGADVLLQSQSEEFLRIHSSQDDGLEAGLVALVDKYDLILVEGHKTARLRKVWLLGDDETAPPDEIENIATVLSRDADRVTAVMDLLEKFLDEQWMKTPLLGCVLIGGKSKRMGRPKHLLQANGKTWLAQTAELLQHFCESVVIAGAGDVPEEMSHFLQLTDAPDVKGPMAGVLAAMRWSPWASWLVAACDLPDLSADALDWLVETRRPGVWAAVPRLKGSCGFEPLLAHYDFRAGALLQRYAISGNFRPAAIVSHPKVISPEVPDHLAGAWRNVNIEAHLTSRC